MASGDAVASYLALTPEEQRDVAVVQPFLTRLMNCKFLFGLFIRKDMETNRITSTFIQFSSFGQLTLNNN
jgi:hypothetical protein